MPLTTRDAVTAIRSHHAALAEGLQTRTAALISEVEMGRPYAGAHSDLEAYLNGTLLPHADAEERVLYRAGDTGNTAPLVRAMIDEHGALRGMSRALADAPSAIMAAAMAYALHKVFDVHLAKENDVLVPALVDRGVDLGRLLEGMQDILGHH